jgi:hypothetical protein
MTTKKAVKKVAPKDTMRKSLKIGDEIGVQLPYEGYGPIRYRSAWLTPQCINDLVLDNEQLSNKVCDLELKANFSESFKKQEIVDLNRAIKEAQTLGIAKAFALFTAGMLAGAVIMKFL